MDAFPCARRIVVIRGWLTSMTSSLAGIGRSAASLALRGEVPGRIRA